MINNVVNVSNGFQPTGYHSIGHGSDVTKSEAVVEKTAALPLTSTTAVKEPATASSEVSAAVTKLNDHVQNLQRTLAFSIDESTGRTIIRVYDSETNELIREIPAEETIRMAKYIDSQNAEIF